MKAVIQRVSQAEVRVEQQIIGKIGRGWLVLLGVTHQDTVKEATALAEKISKLRAFSDNQGKMNLDIQQVSGQFLVVSQFTLYGDCRKGRRPGFDLAAKPDHAEALYETFVSILRVAGFEVATGKFGHHMDVRLHNDGPVTFVLDTQDLNLASV